MSIYNTDGQNIRRAGFAFLIGLVIILLVTLLSTARAFADDTTGSFLQNALVRPGEASRSTGEFRRNSQRTSTYEFAFMMYCLSELSVNHADDAIRDCSEALVLDPENAAAYKLRGMAYFSQKHLDKALRDFDRAVALDPNDPEAQGGRGAVYREWGDTQRAIGAYSRAIAIEPHSSRWWNARCWTRAVARTQLRAALADCDKAIAIDASFVQAYDSRGLVYLQLGQPKYALADYNRALHIRPSLTSALFGRGVAKLRLADQSGQTDIRRARKYDPSIEAAFRRYGIVVNVPGGPSGPSRPVKCPAADCKPSPSAHPEKPAPQNDSEPSRSARVDVDHGAQSTAR